MRRALSALVCAALVGSCAEEPPKQETTTASKEKAAENAQPRPVHEIPTKTPTSTAGAHVNLPDPWSGRADLYAAPPMKLDTKVDLGKVERFTLPNGLEVIAVPRNDVPAIHLALAVRAGDDYDPVDRPGLAQFTASMLRKGTTKRSADDISQAIDFVGGQLAAATDPQSTLVTCTARARDLGLCLDLVSDVTLHPTFPDKEMDEIRKQLLAEVEGVKDNPRALADEHALNLYYGDDDVRGRPLSARSVNAIDRKQLQQFHDGRYAPNASILAVAGDFEVPKLRALLTKYFGGWKKMAKVPPGSDLKPPAPTAMRVRIVDKPDATQAQIAIVGPGVSSRAPDWPAVRLMNYTLGGGVFSSRLMEVVRAQGGKTYGAGSSFVADKDDGYFVATTFTRLDETANVIKLVLGEIDRMKAGGPTDVELTAAKDNLIGGYGLSLETGGDIASGLLAAAMKGLPSDYVEKQPAHWDAVTVADAARAAKDHLGPDALVVVGPAEKVKPMLEHAGFQVTEVVNYADPVAKADRDAAQADKAKAGQSTPAEADAGQKLLALARAAQGPVDKIKDIHTTAHGSLSMQGQSIPISVEEFVLPEKSRRLDLSVAGNKMTQVITESAAWAKQGSQVQDIPPAMLPAVRASLWHDHDFILLHATQPGAKVKRLPDQDGLDVLEIVDPQGNASKLFLDPKTHLITKTEASVGGRVSQEELSDYKPEGGVQFAHKAKRSDPQLGSLDLTYDSIVVNKGLPPDAFKK